MVLFTMSFLRRKSNVRRETFVPFSKISSLSQTLGGFSGITHRGQKGGNLGPQVYLSLWNRNDTESKSRNRWIVTIYISSNATVVQDFLRVSDWYLLISVGDHICPLGTAAWRRGRRWWGWRGSLWWRWGRSWRPRRPLLLIPVQAVHCLLLWYCNIQNTKNAFTGLTGGKLINFFTLCCQFFGQARCILKRSRALINKMEPEVQVRSNKDKLFICERFLNG